MRLLSVAALALAVLLAACAPQSEVDEADAKLAQAEAKINALQAAKDQAEARMSTLQVENDRLRSQLGALAVARAEDRQKLEEKMAMPVTLQFRKAILGGSLVGVFSTTVKETIPALVTVESAALGTVKRFELTIDGNGRTEVEGITFRPGDRITVSNAKFWPVSFVVP